MADFRIMVKGEWKGPFPEQALIKKYQAGGIPMGTKVQDVATGGAMAIEDLAAGNTLILDQPIKAAAKPKLSPAERNAPTQKISKPAVAKPPAAAKPAAPPPSKPAPTPEKPAVVLPKKDSARLPAAKLPKGAATRDAMAPPEKMSRGVNWPFVLGCLALLGGFGAPWFKFEGAMADGTDAMFFGWNLALGLTAGKDKLGAPPPAELFFAANLLWLLWLAPLLALVALIDEFISAAKGRNHWWLRLLAALAAPGVVACGAFLLYWGLQSGVGAEVLPGGASYDEFLHAGFDRLKGHLQLGTYAHAAGSVLLLLSVATSPRRKAPSPPPKPTKESADQPSRVFQKNRNLIS